MSGINVRIIRKDAPSYIPDWLKDSDGQFSFDLEDDVAVAITKQIDQSNEVGKLRQDTVQSFTLPVTEKNRALIGDVGNPNAFNFVHSKAIPVQIISGVNVLPEQEIAVRRTGDQPFEVEAFGEANRWIKEISGIYINKLDFGVLPSYDWNWFDDVHANRWFYQDGTLPIFPPVANYGKRINSGCISIEDLRIWFSPLFILREGFCRAGWKFVCPLLETNVGRRLWTYILAENFQNQVAVTNKAFHAVKTSTSPIVTINNFNSTVFENDFALPGFDNGGFHDSIIGYSGTGIKSDYTAVITINGINDVSVETSAVIVEIRKYTLGGSFVVLGNNAGVNLTNGTHVITATATDATITATDAVRVFVYGYGFSGNVLPGSYWFNTPKESSIQEGDQVNLSDLIDAGYTVLDYLKGIVHLFNFKVETDSILREVRFYPEDGGEFYSEGELEAFFRKNIKAKNWTGKVVCNSLEIDIKASKTKRNFLLSFKNDSGDFKAKNAGFDYPLHSKNIDFGSDFAEGTKKSPNPFFAPTINDFDFLVRYVWGGTFIFPDSAPYMPFLWKSDRTDSGAEPEPITKVTPRIVLSYPNGEMIVPPYGANGVQTSGAVNICRDTFPDGTGRKGTFAAAGQIMPEGFRYSPFGGGAFVPYEDAVVYGTDEYNKNIKGNYEIFYKDAIDRLYFAVPLEFLVRISQTDFINFSPRDRIFIKYFSDRFGEINFYSRVVKISDFVINKSISTPVEFQPNDQSFALDCCNAEIFITNNGIVPGGLQFEANIVGSYGEVISFLWTLSNLGSNVGIVGNSNEQFVIIGSASGAFFFTLDVEIVTTCGTFATSVNIG